MFKIEIMNDDCYVFRSSKKTIWKMCVGYTVHLLMIVLQYFYNFINVQCPFLLSDRMAYFWKGSYRKKQRDGLQRVRKRSLRKVVLYMTQGYSEAMYCLAICMLVNNFSQNLYIRLFFTLDISIFLHVTRHF